MKNIRIVSLMAVVAGSAAITACGNADLLSGLNGSGNAGMSAAQQAAVEELDGHWCQDCAIPDGGAEHLEVGIQPESYTGGALELNVVYVDPNGVVAADGSFRADMTLTINDFDMLATVPAEAWRVSDDGVRARITFYSEAGLPAGSYHVRASITDPDLGSADMSRDWTIADEHHDGDPTPTATEPPHDGDPTPTPTPDHTGDATPTPTPDGGAI